MTVCWECGKLLADSRSDTLPAVYMLTAGCVRSSNLPEFGWRFVLDGAVIDIDVEAQELKCAHLLNTIEDPEKILHVEARPMLAPGVLKPGLER